MNYFAVISAGILINSCPKAVILHYRRSGIGDQLELLITRWTRAILNPTKIQQLNRLLTSIKLTQRRFVVDPK
jgi:hypothetical protein